MPPMRSTTPGEALPERNGKNLRRLQHSRVIDTGFRRENTSSPAVLSVCSNHGLEPPGSGDRTSGSCCDTPCTDMDQRSRPQRSTLSARTTTAYPSVVLHIIANNCEEETRIRAQSPSSRAAMRVDGRVRRRSIGEASDLTEATIRQNTR